MKIFKIFVLATVMMFAGCETFDLDQTENPSTIDQTKLDPVYTFNYVQVQLPAFVNSSNNFSQRVTRQMAMTGGNTYNNAFAPENFDINWTQAYLILNAIKTAEPKAIENGQNFILGANKTIKSYVLMTLVDMYGNIPYSEALFGNDNLTPKFDSGESVYAAVYNELNEAISYLQLPNPNQEALKARDLYYGNEQGNADPSKWIRLANTLKFKMLNNSRLLPSGTLGQFNIKNEMQALYNANQMITEEEYNFNFDYGNIRVNPNSRHPLYNSQYELSGGPYIANYFMWAVSREKTGSPSLAYSSNVPYPYLDPRTKFYFFNQTGNVASTSQIIPCDDITRRPDHYTNAEYYSFYRPKDGSSGTPVPPAFCTTDRSSDGNSFLGRDHGDNSGIPADRNIRTVGGLYPIGGAYGSPEPVAENGLSAGTKGALGEGIMPMIMSSFVHFMIAEAINTEMVVGGSDKSEFMLGIEQSIDRVIQPVNGYPNLDSTYWEAIDAAKTQYISFMDNAWETHPSDHLQLIIKEYYIAAWGNGIEPYNNYRRTGFPANFQPTLELDSGAYFYTAYYPGVSVNNNPNAPSNVRTRRVFWDVANLDLQ